MRYREPLHIFVGWDERETIAYHVLCHSLIERASGPIVIAPLRQEALRSAGLYWRVRGPTESTAFSLTRFLVPAICGFHGHAVFLDSDMLCHTDICELWTYIERLTFWGRGWSPPVGSERNKAVLVAQHDYVPSERTKFLGQQQTTYEKKNWSSVMVFDNARCKALTPDYVNTASGLQLHRFQWLEDETQIGSLPLEYNWLVGAYAPNPDAKLFHWTTGGPWFEEYRDADHADEWRTERDRMLGIPVSVPA